MKYHPEAEPFLISLELILDDILSSGPPKIVRGRSRIALWFRALVCQVRAFSYEIEGMKVKGWVANNGAVYITYLQRVNR